MYKYRKAGRNRRPAPFILLAVQITAPLVRLLQLQMFCNGLDEITYWLEVKGV